MAGYFAQVVVGRYLICYSLGELSMYDFRQYFERMQQMAEASDLVERFLCKLRDDPDMAQDLLGTEAFGYLALERVFYAEQEIETDPSLKSRFVDQVRESIPGHVDKIRLQLNQNQIVYRVALFEMLLKEVQRRILKSDPKRIAANRKVEVSKLAALGFEEVINEEIEREVHSMDRKSIEERASYFKKRLDLDWEKGEMVQKVKRLLDYRNAVLHENPDQSMPESIHSLSHDVCFEVALHICIQGVYFYPELFIYSGATVGWDESTEQWSIGFDMDT